MDQRRVASGGSYPGPSDVGLRDRWRSERRVVIRRHHPDRGGDPLLLHRRLTAIDRRYQLLDQATPSAHLAPPPGWQQIGRVVRRTNGQLGRLTRTARARLPASWPGHRHFFDL